MAPDASIVIPCYDGERTVAEAVASCREQSHPDLEVVVVDDGSRDRSPRIVAEIARRDPRVRLVRQPNRGLAAARNAGIAAARAEVLGFLDADDLLVPDKIERQLALLARHPECGQVAGGHLYLDPDGGRQRAAVPAEGPVALETLVLFNAFHVNATLVRRPWVEGVGGFDEALDATQDWDFHVRLALAGCATWLDPRPVLVYRRQTPTMASDFRRGLRNRLAVADKIYRSEQLPPACKGLRPRTFALSYLIAACNANSQGRFAAARELLAAAFDHDPGLGEERGAEILGHLRRWLVHPSPLSREQRVDGLLDHLPANAPGGLRDDLAQGLR